MDDFVESLGKPYMAHVLRRLYDDFVRNIDCWYQEIGVVAPARTHSTMALLHKVGPLGVTELAQLLRQSHPLVLTWLQQLKQLGFVATSEDPRDRRRTLVSLTDVGRAELEKHHYADRIVAQVYESLMQEAEAPVFDALWRLEQACRREPLLERLRQVAGSMPPEISKRKPPPV